VQQKGSLVDADKTRFDFSHNTPMTGDELRRVEQLVNAEVLKNEETKSQVMSFDEAVKGGAMALFGEKYGDAVRVLDIGFSRELCGGTHVRRTGDIGLFKIVSEGGVAAGVRRVEAVAGEGVLAYLRDTEGKLKAVADVLRTNPDEAPRKVEQLQTRIKVLEKDIEQLRGKLARGESVDLASQAKVVNGVKVLAARLDGADAKGLREAIDQLRDKLAPAAVVLASVTDNKVTLIAGVTKELTGRVHAGELVNQVAIKVGGKGGGRPDMAQAGGTDPSGLEAALSDVHQWVAERLG
jgi:alanyl-tRNA synthetase